MEDNKDIREKTEITENTETAAETVNAEQLKASTAAKRAKKAERREAKASRKEANIVEEKRNRPNNLLLAILIFGVLIGMFAFVKGYNYYKLEPSIQSYIKNNGGKDTYGSMMVDEHTTAAVTAKKNNMKIVLTCEPHEGEEKEYTDYYKGEDGTDQLKYISAYMLTTIKPECRGFSANVNASVTVAGEQVNKVSMTYNEAKKYLEEQEKKAQEEQEKAKQESKTESNTADDQTGTAAESAETEAAADTAAADTDAAADAEAEK
jgi:hypothetical protein